VHLIIFLHYLYFKDARVHCVVLKIRAVLATLAAFLISTGKFQLESSAGY